jgi:iron complex outermembrane receptor protein
MRLAFTLSVALVVSLGGAPPGRGDAAAGSPLPKDPAPEAVLFDAIPAVETAALYAQTLQEAPANVTVITEHEIRRYGYRTLGEALANVRGFYVTWDGVVYYAGVRGFNLPGDYNTRILVLVNGHYLTDNFSGSMYRFGQDFGIDMDLIQRIEVVRGPSSALYGSNGVLATINIFTRSPADSPRKRVSTEFGSFGEKKALVAASTYLGRGANLLVAASGLHTNGRTIETPDFGKTGGVGAEQAYHTLTQFTWRNWSLTASFNDRKTLAPAGFYGADFGDPGTSLRDGRNFIESSWTRNWGPSANLRWRLYYDQYRYRGNYRYTFGGETVALGDAVDADWVGTHLSVRVPVPGWGPLTAGGQFDADIRNGLRTNLAGERRGSWPDQSYGLFAQQVWNASRNWTFFLGARLDHGAGNDPFLSPRFAAIYHPSERSAYKFLYGRAFRNPSTNERYWEPNPLLEAEKIHTFEFVREANLGRRLDAVASVYHYRLTGLIEAFPLSESALQYRNLLDLAATGAEFELRGRPAEWLETAGGVTVQDVHQPAGHGHLHNSPHSVVQMRAAVPLVHDRLSLSVVGRYLSRRLAADDTVLGSVVLADATITTNRLHPQFDLQLGVRNLMNRGYFDPMSEANLLHAFPRAGRTVFVKMIWRPTE